MIYIPSLPRVDSNSIQACLKRCRCILTFLVLISQLSISWLSADPVITSISPSHGTTTGGNTLLIKGSGLKGTTSLLIGNKPSTSFHVDSDDTIIAIVPIGTPGCVDVIASSDSASSQVNEATHYTYLGCWHAYVTNSFSNTLTSINLSTGIENPLTTLSNNFPLHLAITPDGKYAYVVINASKVIAVDIATNIQIASLKLGNNLQGIAITPDGQKVYVIDAGTEQLLSINTSTNLPGPTINLKTSFPKDIAIMPDGQTALIVDMQDNTVIQVNLITGVLDNPIPTLGIGSGSIAITPNGATAYVANATSNNVTPIDLIKKSAGEPINVGNLPQSIAISPDGTKVYVSNSKSNSVTILNGNTVATGSTFPLGIAITPDGKRAYVANFSSNILHRHVIPIDVMSNHAEPSIPAGDRPFGIAITPDQSPIAAFSITPAGNALSKTFDASASISPVGSIVSYQWDFGDGQTQTTSSPIVTHSYASGGSFQAKLTVINSAGTSTEKVFTGHTMSNNGGPLATTTKQCEIVVQASPTTSKTPAASALSPSLLPLPPREVKGILVFNRSFSNSSFFNMITWKAPTGGSQPVAYRIYRDRALTKRVAILPATTLKYKDHKIQSKKDYNYYIISVDKFGKKSKPVKALINKK